MVFQYKDREMFHGNHRLLIAKLTGVNETADVVYGTGLVSISAMEDYASIAGATLLKGLIA